MTELRDKLVLVVDDEVRITSMMRMNLEAEGVRVIAASNGREALDAIREEIPDIVILDVMMPGMDGYETLRRIRMSSQAPGHVNVDERLHIDFNKREVLINGERVNLRPTEYRLLYHIVQRAGFVMTHNELLAKVWGPEYHDETHYLRLYVTYLRQKIEIDPANPVYILTERGVGYRFKDLAPDSIS
jgi:two-component system KDP operon response regulator KdpE